MFTPPHFHFLPGAAELRESIVGQRVYKPLYAKLLPERAGAAAVEEEQILHFQKANQISQPCQLPTPRTCLKSLLLPHPHPRGAATESCLEAGFQPPGGPCNGAPRLSERPGKCPLGCPGLAPFTLLCPSLLRSVTASAQQGLGPKRAHTELYLQTKGPPSGLRGRGGEGVPNSRGFPLAGT